RQRPAEPRRDSHETLNHESRITHHASRFTPPMEPNLELLQQITRRNFLKSAGQFSLGAIALAGMLKREAGGTAESLNLLAVKKPHYEPKIKRVIYLHMSGGPPHLDLFDYKPELVKYNEKPCPDEFLKGRKFAFTSGVPKLMGTPRQFAQYGKGGIWMRSEERRVG